MASIIRTDALQNLNTSNIISQTNATTLTIGASGQTISLASGASSSGFGATYNGAVNWTSTLVTSALTVAAGTGYFVNTSTASITVTLPASPTFGSIVGINDYSGYAATNIITVNPNGNKLEGGTGNKLINTNKESVILNYVDSTRGWLATSGVNNGTDALTPASYTVDFLVVAGGGSGGSGAVNTSAGGGGAGGYRNSYSTEQSGGGGSSEASLSFVPGTVYTVTIGAGGTGTTGSTQGNNGSNSSISGTGITTITSIGGGGAGGDNAQAGNSGGSGGGGGRAGTGGAGTANQGFGGGGGAQAPNYPSGGGGGSGAVGTSSVGSVSGNGGAGLASSITGSSVTRAAGSAGSGNSLYGATDGSNPATAGTPSSSATGGNANANTGSGGGGGVTGGGNGGSGVVILRMPTASYSGTTTGSPTVTTSGSDTIVVFNSSGSITG
jgi:hypothetical protein